MSQTFTINRWNIFFQLVSNMIKTLVPQVKEHFGVDESMMLDEIIKYFGYEDLATWLILDTEENRPVSKMALDQIMMNIDFETNLSKTMKEGILNSFNGLYRVNNISSEFIFLENLLFKEPPKHVPVKSGVELEEGMILLTRLVETNSYPLMYKVLHKIEATLAEDFYDQFITVYRIMEEFKDCSASLLKQRGLDIFLLYSNTYREIAYSEDEILSEYERQFPDFFHEHVISVNPLNEKNDLLETFIFIQEEYLEEKNLNFQNLNEIDLDELMKDISNDGTFESDYELSEFVSFLEEWAHSQGFDDKIDEIKEIQSHIFNYKMLLQQSVHGIYLDDYIMSCIYEEGGPKDPEQFMKKFNHFLELFHQYPYFNLTDAGRFTRGSIDIFIDELKLKRPTSVQNYSEIHFPKLHLWHVMGLMKKLLLREDKKLYGTSKFDYFQRLNEEGQLGLWIQSIFNPSFLERAFSTSPKSFSSGDGEDMMENYRLIFQELENCEMTREDLIIRGVQSKDLFVIDLLLALNLIYKVSEGIYSLTNLGKKIGSYYNFIEGDQDGILYMERS